jgi:hypothetical protein
VAGLDQQQRGRAKSTVIVTCERSEQNSWCERSFLMQKM